MPYIKEERRKSFDVLVSQLVEKIREYPDEDKDGCINYFMCRLLLEMYPKKYFHMNRMMGVLECIKQELYRRYVAPYENIKIKESGDIL